AQEIKSHHQRVVQVLHLEPVQIAPARRPCVFSAVAKLLHVDDEEDEQPQAREDHGGRRERFSTRRPRVLPLHVSNWARLLIPQEHAYRLEDMNEEDRQEPELDDRQQWIALERVGVLVEERWTAKDQQVSGDVNEKIKKEREAGGADEELRPDRRTQ